MPKRKRKADIPARTRRSARVPQAVIGRAINADGTVDDQHEIVIIDKQRNRVVAYAKAPTEQGALARAREIALKRPKRRTLLTDSGAVKVSQSGAYEPLLVELEEPADENDIDARGRLLLRDPGSLRGFLTLAYEDAAKVEQEWWCLLSDDEFDAVRKNPSGPPNAPQGVKDAMMVTHYVRFVESTWAKERWEAMAFFAAQLGMAYQRFLLREAEEPAKRGKKVEEGGRKGGRAANEGRTERWAEAYALYKRIRPKCETDVEARSKVKELLEAEGIEMGDSTIRKVVDFFEKGGR